MNYPSVMVCIKKFYLDEMIDEALHVPHPTFIVDGAELDEVSLYANNGANALPHILHSLIWLLLISYILR